MFSGQLWKCISTVNGRQLFRRCHANALGQIAKEMPMKYYGQPTAETHPHLLKSGEILPLISATELRERRQKLAHLVRESIRKRHSDIKNHTIIIQSAYKSIMSERIPYIFRQNSDFLYLSGCQEPETCLVIDIHEGKDAPVAILFLRERDSHSELWDGPRTDCSDAQHIFGVDMALPIKELPKFLIDNCKGGNKTLWYDTGIKNLWYETHQGPQRTIYSIITECLTTNEMKIWDSPKTLVHRLRLIKSPAEIELMKRSCEIAAQAFQECMKRSFAGINEHDLFAIMEYESRIRGAEFLAYPPVIAGGNRATTIHYVSNNNTIPGDQMVLMDAGCEYHGYAADITRTWPVNGKFTAAQAQLYEVVLDVQKNLIKLLGGGFTLDKLYDEMCLLLGRGLQELGICQRTSSIDTTMKQSHQFCPHHVSHYLGMDVHDSTLIPRNIPMQPGMIVTVEPGIYISHAMMNAPKEFRGIGIRIEDNVLITDDAPIVLTAMCPKKLDDIERIVSTKVGK